MVKKDKLDRIIKERIFLTVTLLVIVVSMSVGYAYYSEELSILARIELTNSSSMIKKGEVTAYENAYNEEIRYSNLDDQYTLNISNTFKFVESNSKKGLANYISYSYILKNQGTKKLMFTSLDCLNEGEILINEPILEGLEEGQVLNIGEELAITITYFNKEKLEQDYYIESSLKLVFTDDTNYEKTSSVTVSTATEVNYGDLIPVNLEILSTYAYSKYFTISTDSEIFTITDENGNVIEDYDIIKSGIMENYTVYLKLKEDKDLNESTNVNLYLKDSSQTVLSEVQISVIL